MAEYHKDETQKALKKYKFTALEHVFNAEFLEKVYEFKDNDPIQELYNTGLINYSKNLHLNTEMNKLHEKLVLLDYGLENIIKRYNLENWLEKCKKKYLQEKENTENKNAILGELYTAGFFARISLDSLKEITPDTKQKKRHPILNVLLIIKKLL